MSTSKFHKNFKLNGRHFQSENEILLYSKRVSLEVFSFFESWFDTNEFISVRTSGSTGKPAHIKLKKEHMIHSALATGSYFKLPENTTALLCLSTNYIAGKMMLVRALVLGWHLDIVEPSIDPLKKIKKKYIFCAMVPLQLQNSLSEIHCIKKLIVGGGVVSTELQKKLQDVTTEVLATYGMTETITHIAVKKLNHFQEVTSSAVEMSLGNQDNLQTFESNYKVLPNINISIDQRGCLVIDAPEISDNKVITNDLVKLISDTEFEWIGRYDSIINSGGVKLIPEMIEEKLATTIVGRFFVAGIPDEILGEKLVLIIENKKGKLKNGIATISEAQFRNDEQNKKVLSNEPVRQAGADEKSQYNFPKSLSSYEIPKEIYYVDHFIETETKKIQRQKTLDLIFKS